VYDLTSKTAGDDGNMLFSDKFNSQEIIPHTQQVSVSLTYISGHKTYVIIGYMNGFVEVRDLAKPNYPGELYSSKNPNDSSQNNSNNTGAAVMLCEILSRVDGGGNEEMNLLSVHLDNYII